MKTQLSFLTILLLLFVTFLGLITFIFDMSGWRFYLEFLVLLGLLLFGTIGILLIHNKASFGYVLCAVVSGISLLNLLLIYFILGMTTLLFLSMVSAITAFVLNVVGFSSLPKAEEIPAPPSKPLNTYTPGKVIASRTSSYYHVPTCDWAKNINKKNQVWYESDTEAREKGLKAHSCAK